MIGSRAARPSVSVLLPCRDAESWLSDCLDSLFAQSLPDIEVIAVDDGSSDGTVSLLWDRASREPRLRVLDGTGKGLVPALNLAASQARSPLLARMDADDVSHPERLQSQLRFLEDHPSLAACGTAVRLFPRRGLGSGYRRYERWLNGLTDPDALLADLFVECPIAHPTLMVRASAFHAVGGYRDMGWPEDYDFVLRLHSAGMKAANLSRPLLDWRVHADRHSLCSAVYSPQAFRRCKVHFLGSSVLPTSRPIVVWGAGKVGKPVARELLRQGMSVSAFVDLDPRKIGQEIHGAPVLSPSGFENRTRIADPYVLVAVGSPGARDEIRDALETMGRKEITDYRVCS